MTEWHIEARTEKGARLYQDWNGCWCFKTRGELITLKSTSFESAKTEASDILEGSKHNDRMALSKKF